MNPVSNSLFPSATPVSPAEKAFVPSPLKRSPSAKIFTLIKDPITQKVIDVTTESARWHVPSSPQSPSTGLNGLDKR